MIRPEHNPRVTAAGYYQWLKAVLRSGDVDVFRAARIGVLVTCGWGHWGHHAYPSRPTLQAASGVSAKTISRGLALLVDAGWLHVKRGYNRRVYCVALVRDGRPVVAGPAGPCPLCFPPSSGATRTDWSPVSTDSSAGDTGVLSEGTPVSPY